MVIKGKVWSFGDHINTDDIVAARYLNSTDPKELAAHCMETIRPEFAASFSPGDIVVAGDNFGCGSSREHAPIALKGCGVSVVIATSFARIFQRNAINIGLPLIELAEATSIQEGDRLEVNLEAGTVKNLSRGREFEFMKYPEFLQQIIENGGLMRWVQKKYIKSV